MPVNITFTSIYTPAPLSTVTFTATPEAEELDRQVRELCERWKAHEPVLKNLVERIDALATWGTTWEDYDAEPPTPATIDNARRWIKQFYLDVVTNGRAWIDPLITATDEGAASFAWKHRDRVLEIEVDETTARYSKTSGTEPNFEFEDGCADSAHRRLSLWAWLGG